MKGVVIVALSEAKKAADKRYNAKLCQIMIRPYKSEGDEIRAAATASGKSVQAYILQAIREKMQREIISSPQAEEISSSDNPAAPCGQVLQIQDNELQFSTVLRWDYGLSPEQREDLLEKDRKRLTELNAIRTKREFTEKEYLELMYLLTAHRDD